MLSLDERAELSASTQLIDYQSFMKPHYSSLKSMLYNLVYYESMYDENGNTEWCNKEVILSNVSRHIVELFIKGLEVEKNIKFDKEDDEFILETPESAKTYAHVYVLEKVF